MTDLGNVLAGLYTCSHDHIALHMIYVFLKGLLHMNLPQRLRYILEVCRPPASVVIQIMEILIRVAQNSSEAAYEVNCGQLFHNVRK